MLLLPIAALAVMAFLAIVIMLCVATKCEQRERARASRERLFCGVALRVLNENSRLIWGTQLPALQYLEAGARGGVAADSLRSWYAEMRKRYPALYEGHGFAEWLQFLQDTGVIVLLQERVALGAYGYTVLDHCRDSCRHDSRWPR